MTSETSSYVARIRTKRLVRRCAWGLVLAVVWLGYLPYEFGPGLARHWSELATKNYSRQVLIIEIALLCVASGFIVMLTAIGCVPLVIATRDLRKCGLVLTVGSDGVEIRYRSGRTERIGMAEVRHVLAGGKRFRIIYEAAEGLNVLAIDRSLFSKRLFEVIKEVTEPKGIYCDNSEECFKIRRKCSKAIKKRLRF